MPQSQGLDRRHWIRDGRTNSDRSSSPQSKEGRLQLHKKGRFQSGGILLEDESTLFAVDLSDHPKSTFATVENFESGKTASSKFVPPPPVTSLVNNDNNHLTTLDQAADSRGADPPERIYVPSPHKLDPETLCCLNDERTFKRKLSRSEKWAEGIRFGTKAVSGAINSAIIGIQTSASMRGSEDIWVLDPQKKGVYYYCDQASDEDEATEMVEIPGWIGINETKVKRKNSNSHSNDGV